MLRWINFLTILYNFSRQFVYDRNFQDLFSCCWWLSKQQKFFSLKRSRLYIFPAKQFERLQFKVSSKPCMHNRQCLCDRKFAICLPSFAMFIIFCSNTIYQIDVRLDSNIEWKSLNNTYLNIIEISTKLLKKIEHHQIANFDKNFDLGKIAILRQKVEFLSQSKIRKISQLLPLFTAMCYELTTVTALTTIISTHNRLFQKQRIDQLL